MTTERNFEEMMDHQLEEMIYRWNLDRAKSVLRNDVNSLIGKGFPLIMVRDALDELSDELVADPFYADPLLRLGGFDVD